MHSKEPWRIPLHNGKPASWIVSAEDSGVTQYLDESSRRFYQGELVAESLSADDARRIVVCVNACTGLSTETLERIVAEGMRLVLP